MEIERTSGIIPDIQVELVVHKKPYEIFNTGDHQSADQHLKQQGNAGMKNMLQHADQQEADPGGKKH